MNQEKNIIESLLHFTTKQDVIDEDLIITTILLNECPIFVYPTETSDTHEADKVAVNAFLYSLERNYGYKHQHSLDDFRHESLFDELI